MISDVIIIGGGAAGLCAGVYLKKHNKNLSVRIIEALPRVGKKLAITGNGRCNISNSDINISRYHGENTEFCRYALENYDLTYTMDFFDSIGVCETLKYKTYFLSLSGITEFCSQLAAETRNITISARVFPVE